MTVHGDDGRVEHGQDDVDHVVTRDVDENGRRHDALVDVRVNPLRLKQIFIYLFIYLFIYILSTVMSVSQLL